MILRHPGEMKGDEDRPALARPTRGGGSDAPSRARGLDGRVPAHGHGRAPRAPPCTSSSACLAWRCSSRRRRCPYRETVTRRAENVEGSSRQSGGKGMYGVCYLTVEPETPWGGNRLRGRDRRRRDSAQPDGGRERRPGGLRRRPARRLPGCRHPGCVASTASTTRSIERNGLQARRLVRLQGCGRAGAGSCCSVSS